MKKFVLVVGLLVIVLITGCENFDVSKLSDKDLERISDKLIVCPEKYMRFYLFDVLPCIATLLQE